MCFLLLGLTENLQCFGKGGLHLGCPQTPPHLGQADLQSWEQPQHPERAGASQPLLNVAASPNLQIKYSSSSQKENDLREWEFSQLCVFAARTEHCSSWLLEVVCAHKTLQQQCRACAGNSPHISVTRGGGTGIVQCMQKYKHEKLPHLCQCSQ